MEGSYTFRILCCFGITIDGPIVLWIEIESASKVGIPPALDLTLFDSVYGISPRAVQDIVLDWILGIVDPCFLDETAVDETMVVVFDVLKGVIGKWLSCEELGGLGGCS